MGPFSTCRGVWYIIYLLLFSFNIHSELLYKKVNIGDIANTT